MVIFSVFTILSVNSGFTTLQKNVTSNFEGIEFTEVTFFAYPSKYVHRFQRSMHIKSIRFDKIIIRDGRKIENFYFFASSI